MQFSKGHTAYVFWIHAAPLLMVILWPPKLFISDGDKKITEKKFSVEPLKLYVMDRFWPLKAKKAKSDPECKTSTLS